MTPGTTPRERSIAAQQARNRLAEAYDALATEFSRAARRLRTTPVSMLAGGEPVPYVSRSTRALEDALDEALTAL